MDMVIIDIWGGENSQDYLARYVKPIDEVDTVVRRELSGGFLVNLLTVRPTSDLDEFDDRIKPS